MNVWTPAQAIEPSECKTLLNQTNTNSNTVTKHKFWDETQDEIYMNWEFWKTPKA